MKLIFSRFGGNEEDFECKPFVIGYLNMATSRIAPVSDFEIESDESAVEVEFADEDDFPLSCVHSRSNNFP